ncbi:MAG: peptide chain release factor 1, partial [Acidobacteria bacterium]
MHFFDKLAEIEKKYDELSVELSAPGVFADPARYQKAAKAHADLRAVVEKFRQWKEVQKGLVETKTLLEESAADPAMKTMAHEEIAGLERRQGEIEAELKVLLVPKDPNDEKNVVLEIRAGTGGDEATLFAQEVF